MAYTCELGPGQRIYLDNIGGQTAVTLYTGNGGQQQQSGSQFTTGAWTTPPEVFRTDQGVVIKLTTAQGVHHLQLQGNQMGWMTGSPSLGQAQQMQTSAVSTPPGGSMPTMEPMPAMGSMSPMTLQPIAAPPPMQPMQPMQPMKMGNMEMNANPMEMRMGNMEMRMGEAFGSSPASPSVSAPASANQPKFCSQCGTSVKAGDRFCANCGHQLVA